MTYKLFKIFLANQYAFQEFLEGFKKGGKNIAKNIFIILCGLYLFGIFGFFFLLFTINTYSSFSLLGNTDFYPSVMLLLSFFLIFNFGIISVSSTYYAGNGEEQFLSLPLTPKQFFSAKFGVSFITDAVIGILLFAIGCGYYGYKEGLLINPLFYIGTLLTASTIALLTIFLIYFLLIIVLYFVPAFRKRNILTGIASFFIIIIAFGFGFLSSFTSSSGNSSNMIETTSNKLLEISEKVPLISFFSDAIKGKIVPILVLLTVCALVIFVFIPLMSSLYIKTFEGSSDVKTKRLSKEKIQKVVKAETKKTSIFKAMLLRDIKGVWREPTFFANGPLMVFLFPFIMVGAFILPILVKGGSGVLNDMVMSASNYLSSCDKVSYDRVLYFTTFSLIVFTLFITSMNMVGATSFSREGKGFYVLKALPIRHEIIIKAKLIHSLMYAALSCLISTVIALVLLAVFGFPYSVKETISMFLIMWFTVCAISILLNIIDMLFDTINPKLNWETPNAAMKQNMNAMFSMLVNLGAVVILFVLGILFGSFEKPNSLFLLLIGVIFILIALPVGSVYFKYADKKISNL